MLSVQTNCPWENPGTFCFEARLNTRHSSFSGQSCFGLVMRRCLLFVGLLKFAGVHHSRHIGTQNAHSMRTPYVPPMYLCSYVVNLQQHRTTSYKKTPKPETYVPPMYLCVYCGESLATATRMTLENAQRKTLNPKLKTLNIPHSRNSFLKFVRISIYEPGFCFSNSRCSNA